MVQSVEEIRDNMRHEKHTIFPISLDLRHGKAFDLFTLWFGSNLQLLTITVGMIATESSGFGLPFVWAMIALMLGNMVGAIFMALHSAQGSYLGISQMQQSRAQFGSYGALPILVLVVIMYIGYFASLVDVGEQAIASIIPNIGKNGSYFIITGLSILAFIAAYIGYDLIHKYAKFITVIGGLSLLIILFSGIGDTSLASIHVVGGSFSMVGFFGALGMAAIWQISYAPYVSDYSRYLPKETGQKTAFWSSYLGATLGATIAMTVGSLIGLTSLSSVSGGFGAFSMLFGVIGTIFIVTWSVSGVEAAAMQLYCSSLTSISILQTFIQGLKTSRIFRFTIIFFLLLVSTAIAMFASAKFMGYFTNFIYFLLYVLVPWSIINLVDYYLIHDGQYDIESFYVKGGKFGYINKKAALAYVLGFLLEIPFMSNALYTGPIAKMIGGADISWLIASPFIAAFYYIIARPDGVKTHRRLASIFRSGSTT
ncbi:permease for cytosine/purines uracil thiamine allantoin [Acidithiobacillus ferrivorans SS3]|uniref:Permease for cytosine/purines uracil thiamine allantoin n=1 Tax=Acidithiobacillus ferrivorans SS3 TaxID=743299 RepID=G0JP43_9PROT|nr:cytosine permease [Acidithiobacillus ferrivorans]AEM48458.1 permease for cytosine/purines uracil thiamine allantoin [Acidithiobacillus ferrivorans SS3]